MDRVVMFSGGAGSWAAAKRVAARYGAADLTLLFADTLIEDTDLYRFLDEAAANTGGQLVKTAEGRTPWQVFNDEGIIGNTRADPCSRVLKREHLRRWLANNCDPADTAVYLGIDWTEYHRFERAKAHWEPWKVEAPMCEPPLLMKDEVLAWLESEGIRPPRLYRLGFPHNNCGGGCVKAGIAHWAHLLKTLPDRYAWWEEQEESFRAARGKDVAILRDRTGGATKPLPLRVLRQRLETPVLQSALDLDDWGGCGCFSPDDTDNPGGR